MKGENPTWSVAKGIAFLQSLPSKWKNRKMKTQVNQRKDNRSKNVKSIWLKDAQQKQLSRNQLNEMRNDHKNLKRRKPGNNGGLKRSRTMDCERLD